MSKLEEVIKDITTYLNRYESQHIKHNSSHEGFGLIDYEINILKKYYKSYIKNANEKYTLQDVELNLQLLIQEVIYFVNDICPTYQPNPKEFIISLIIAEMNKATENFTKYNSYTEFFYVLLEERDELWDIVKTNCIKYSGGEIIRKENMRSEAIQIGAVALRYLVENCGGKSNE